MSEVHGRRFELLDAGAPASLAHPAGFDEGLGIDAAATMISRALNCVDPRLVDHGRRVAAVLDAMLEVDGTLDADERRAVRFVALLHDVGAYRTEEIDRLITFETDQVWEHSFYGYLFFKELSPLSAYARVVLLHHLPDALFDPREDARVRFLAQALHVADRVDVLLLEEPDADAARVRERFAAVRPGQLSSAALALFAEAERRFGVIDRLQRGDLHPLPLDSVGDAPAFVEAASFLDMLVHVIDFRSRHTVTHTVTTAWVAYELALRLLGDEAAAARVYRGALLHDLGKIGVPLGILEKPGALDPDEMAVMRTHVTLTEGILAGCVDDDVFRAAVRHHEKLDGSGYPRGLTADEIAPSERIVAVADIVSALVGTRSYKASYPKEKVLAILRDQAQRGLVDAEAVEAMERDYDAIMVSVARASAPVAETYRRVQEGYRRLVEKLDQTEGEAE